MESKSLIRQSVSTNIEAFLETSGGEGVVNLYDIVLQEVERGLLEATMSYTGGNQSLATSILTMSRATLRKKLETYDLLYHGNPRHNSSALLK